MSVHVFDADTALKDLGGDASGARRFEASMSRRWWIVRGPNGGYVAAVLLRAMTAAVDDAARAARSDDSLPRLPAKGRARSRRASNARDAR